MPGTRWTSYAMIGLIFVLLTACGGGPGPNASEASADGKTDGQAAAVPASRMVEHKFGNTQIPAQPKRIASIQLEDMLLSLDAPLVLANTVGAGNYLEQELKARHVKVLSDGKLNYESVLQAAPEVIVASDVITQEEYDALSKIAPTVTYNRRTWQSSILEIGRDLGVPDKAAAVMKAHEDAIKQAQEAVAKAVGEQATAALVRVTAKDLRLYFPAAPGEKRQGYATVLYHDLKLVPDPLVAQLQKKEPARENANVSMELLPQITADYLFVTVGSASGTAEELQKDLDSFAEIQKSPLWQSIPAVRKGRVFTVSAKHWISDGLLADEMKLKDAVKALTSQ